MNDKIRQLALQAGQGEPFHIPPEFIEKFAELIVKEMLQTCEDHPAWTGRMIGEQIKRTFWS